MLSGDKPLPSLSECGKKYIMFKSLGKKSYLCESSSCFHDYTGMAIEDVLTGSMVYDRYIKRAKTENTT